jgi:membrane-bound serine protease (ClpP class)
MDGMIRRILASKIPVLTFIGPAGASCGSAGVYILYASHVAAMAPGTNIGSATPVMIGSGGETAKPSSSDIPKEAGADDQINLKRKQIHHAIGQIRSLAEYHGRNADFGEKTITEAANVTSTTALQIHAIDLIVSTPEELLASVQGKRVRMLTGTQELLLNHAEIRKLDQGVRTRFLTFLAHPAVASILMMIGVLGILGEIQYPGSIFPGVIGALCLLLGLYAMQTLPVNYAGAGLILLGVILMILEIKVVSYGMLAVAGVISFALGGVMLVRSGGEVEKATIALIAGSGIAIGSVMAALIYLARKSQNADVQSGAEQMLRSIGMAETVISPSGGRVRVHSELWNARTEGSEIPEGAKVRILERDGTFLRVERVADKAP